MLIVTFGMPLWLCFVLGVVGVVLFLVGIKIWNAAEQAKYRRRDREFVRRYGPPPS